MRVAGGNLVLSSSGLRLVEEAEVGSAIFGVNRYREFCFCEIETVQEDSHRDVFLVLSTSGEALVTADSLLPVITGQCAAISLAQTAGRDKIKIERLPVLDCMPNIDCSDAGCVGRMLGLLLKSVVDLPEIRFRNLGILSESTRHELRLRNGTIRAFEYYMSPKNSEYMPSALFHEGPCRGYELLFSFSKDGRIHVQQTAARQAWQLFVRSKKAIPSLSVTPSFAPLYVQMLAQNAKKFDRVEGMQFLGPGRCFDLSFRDRHFTPVVGSLPAA